MSSTRPGPALPAPATRARAAEPSEGDRTGRIGYFQLSRVPNEKITAVDFSQASTMVEVERRQRWFGRDGALKVLAYVNRASMGSYTDAVALAQATGGAPNIAAVRRRASRPGFSLDVEQAVADGVGLFARAGINGGSKEAYEFTEINRTWSGGVSIDGARWQRSGDTLGVAAVVNQLSRPARAFFAAGGIGILIGDGRLDDRSERIVEIYDAIRLASFATLSFDDQHIDNPAYNHDRGPVSVHSARLHPER